MDRKTLLGLSIIGLTSIFLSELFSIKMLSTLGGIAGAIVLFFTVKQEFRRLTSDTPRTALQSIAAALRFMFVAMLSYFYVGILLVHLTDRVTGLHILFLTTSSMVLLSEIMLYIKPSPKDSKKYQAKPQPKPTSQGWQPFSSLPSNPTLSQDNVKKNIFSPNELQLILDENVIGQSYAKTEITKTLSKNVKKQNALHETSPILGTFFFVGPTGVGKTETSKAIAKYFEKFGYQYLRFDMGNFSDYHTASTLVGSPKGYIGSEEGGALTRPLMENPRAVILFDEMEKAHPSLFKTFMSLIDEGEIQEVSTGVRVKLDQAIIIFTSNLYQEAIGKLFEVVKDEIEREKIIRDILTGEIMEASQYLSYRIIEKGKARANTRANDTSGFPPEFIGRIDKIVPFASLTYDDYCVIVSKLAIKYGVKVDPKALTNKYISIAETYGVRQFIKKIEEEILT